MPRLSLSTSSPSTFAPLAALLLALAAAPALADVHEQEGGYARLGLGTGFVDESRVDPGFALELSGGFFMQSWVSAHLDLSGLVRADIDRRFARDGELSGILFTVGPRFYPLGAVDSDVPDAINPYAQIGFGYGHFYSTRPDDDDGTGFARFAGGLEVMPWDSVGIFFQGGYDKSFDDDVIEGMGHLLFGGLVRFGGP